MIYEEETDEIEDIEYEIEEVDMRREIEEIGYELDDFSYIDDLI
jgi:hypothetical protein